MFNKSKWHVVLLSALVILAALAGCATPTPRGHQGNHRRHRGGRS